MARSKKQSGPVPVESIGHQETRTNIPTADAREFFDADADLLEPVRYPRDPNLDPQLVWRGKDTLDGEDLVVDAPPIYIQEKIDPLALVENLRRTAEHPEDEPELALFDEFDGLDELSQVEFYQHQAKWSNRMILGDSLQVMTSLAERESLRGQVQMVYLDPPYGIKFNSNWQVSARKRDVKDGKLDHAAREAEQIKAFRDTWADGIHSYLTYLRDRLVAARDLLTESGSCFVQIGDENVHVVRSLMDEVFGPENFISLISYATTAGATGDFLPGTTDFIIWYGKDRGKSKFRKQFTAKVAGGAGASKYTLSDEKGRLFRLDNLTSQSQGREKGAGAASWFPVVVDDRAFLPNMQSRWKTNEAGMNRLQLAGRIARSGNTISYVRYLDDFPAFAISNSWTDVGGVQSRADPKIYVVQTSTRAIERCMLMTTDPGDLVLDPTCGSGTTAYVAEQWGRRWITIDTSRVALALARQRLMGAKYPYYLISDTPEGKAKEAEESGKPADPAIQTTGDIRHGFVYERVQHITLKSIANNPDIVEGMSREEIDAAINRHADFEYLYDKPYEDKKRVRVSGPFTVESLSPYRSVAFTPGDDPSARRHTISEASGAGDPDGTSFEQSILDNLREAGIQNGRRKERIEFAAITDFAGTYIQALGESRAEGDQPETTVALAVGPQYGTVDADFIKQATREALPNGDIGLLCVLAFAFDPQAIGSSTQAGVTVDASDEGFAEVASERKLGRLPVLLVRMNSDLLMGEDLKKTGAGNLFTVFGEPDIEIHDADDNHLVVELKGVDVYDPTHGTVRSNDTNQIALWMIDTDYNEESFFVRHCYFTGGGDPYKRLKTSLKADIDHDAWASLYDTKSRPFARPSTGRIAVKVINDYGDEVMKVFDVSTQEA